MQLFLLYNELNEDSGLSIVAKFTLLFKDK